MVAISVSIKIFRDRRHEIGDPGDDDQFQIEVLDFLMHQVEHDDRSRSRVAQLVGQLIFRVGRIAGDDDGACPQDAEVRDDCLWRIRQAERHAIPLANAQRRKAAGESLNQRMTFLVRQGLAKKIEGRPA